MIYTIGNEELRLSVASIGAEMQSIQSKKSGCEFLWQGDKNFWHGRAYNLFPVNGRMFESTYILHGKTYTMPLHGFVRNQELEMVEKTNNSLSFQLRDNELSHQYYPFSFVYTITYTLKKNKIEITVSVKNNGEDTMYFGMGAHPGFNVPLEEGKSFEEYTVSFPNASKVKRCILSDSVLDMGKEENYPLTEKEMSLYHEMFNQDAVVLTGTGGTAILSTKNGKRLVKVEYPQMKYIGFWHKQFTKAPFLCLEPWSMLPGKEGTIEDFSKRKDILSLEQGKLYTNDWSITIEEK